MSLVWDSFPGSGSELLVMLKFADYADDNGFNVYPSIATMAKHARLSESQARRVIHGLLEHGWVLLVGNEFGGAPGTTRQYRVNVEKLRQMDLVTLTPGADATPSVDATPGVYATPRTGARDGSHGCARRVAPMTPNPSISTKEPSVYSAEFESAWTDYPKRTGNNSKKDAYRAWNARLKAGHTTEAMHEGVKRYAAYCEATDRLGTEYVMQAATFFGPDDPPKFSNPWTPPPKRPTAPAMARRPQTDDEIQALGNKFGIEPKRGESMGAYKARVCAEFDRRQSA